MTTNTTPDDFTDASWLGALTSHTWLGDLADELGPGLAQEFTDNRRCYYEHGHAGLRMPAGDLDGATTTLRALVAVIGQPGRLPPTHPSPPTWWVPPARSTTSLRTRRPGCLRNTTGCELPVATGTAPTATVGAVP